MGSAEEETAVLARRLKAIVDPTMRTAYMRHTLLQMEPGDVADVLMIARAQAEAHVESHRDLLSCMSLALADPSCEALRTTVHAIVASRGLSDLALSLARQEAPVDDEELQRIPDFGVGRPLTLGERKSLARRSDRDLIARVLRDPHPDVIQILLGNPVLTEQDVVRLSARRPVAPDVLRQVFRHPKWVLRYEVKLALVLNPHSPLDVALQLAPLLKRQDLRRVAAAGDLHPSLREACRQQHGGQSVH